MLGNPKPWYLGLLAAALSLSALWADRVVLTNGGVVEGEIVSQDDEKVIVRLKSGTMREIPLSRVASVEKTADIFTDFAQRQKALRPYDVDAHHALGLWCLDKGLYPQAIDLFQRVIRLDPEHRPAREQLGYRKLDGKWLNEDEYLIARGYVLHEGHWIRSADKKKYDQGLVPLDDGIWVPAASLAEADKKRVRKPQIAAEDQVASSTLAAKIKQGRVEPKVKVLDKPAINPTERAAQLEKKKAEGGWAFATSSKYYDLYSNGDTKEVQSYGFIMDLMFENYQKIFDYKETPPEPFPIWLYASQSEFMSKTGMGQGVGGFYDGERIVAFHGGLGSLSTQEVLFHEGTHQFQGLVFGQKMWSAPIWFIEGLAVYFEASQVEGKNLKISVIPKARLATLKNAIRSGEYVPLRDLLRIGQAQFGAFHYAHAWGFIFFLIHGAKGGQERFVEYYKQLRDSNDDPQVIFERLFDKPLAEIEEGWKAYIQGLQ